MYLLVYVLDMLTANVLNKSNKPPADLHKT